VKWLTLFAGAGGSDIGIEAAGGEAVACVEYDPDACATLAAAGFPAVLADVREWTREHGAGCRARGMWASFPCQCWSSAGKRLGARDERNGWPWTVDAIDAVGPDWFVAENVPGLLKHSEKDCGDVNLCPGCYFGGVILPQLRERFAWVGVWHLNASSWGVPQNRRRLFMVAGPRAVRPPPPTRADPGQIGMFAALQPWVSLGAALGVAREDATGPEPWRLDVPSLAVLARASRGYSGGLARGRSACGASDGWYLATGEWRLTRGQCSTLQGFPDDHPWQGGSEAVYRQIGNAVPPALAAAVAGAVELANTARTPDEHHTRSPQ